MPWIIPIFLWLHAGSYALTGCPNTVRLQWSDARNDLKHDYSFSLVEFNEKSWSFYNDNRRPPLKEVFFIHKLPDQERAKFDALCKPASYISDSIAYEVSVFESDSTGLGVSWLNETISELEGMSGEFSDAENQVWPLKEALTRTRSLLYPYIQHPLEAPPKVSFVVCHCREALDWLVTDVKNIPRDSRLFVYEKCGVDSSRSLQSFNASRVFSGGIEVIPQPDGEVRGDECTAYLQYIRDMYLELPSYTVFLQADADHHLFFSYLSTALGGIESGRFEVPFLHLNFHRHYQTTTPCMRDVERVIFNYTDDIRVEALPLIGTYCCAQFIVSRERILRHPIDFYERTLFLVDGSVKDICSPGPPRRSSHCYVLEYLWHIVFGEDRYLPFRPDDARLPTALRSKYGNEKSKTRWDDVILAKGTGRLINKTVECYKIFFARIS